MAKRKLLMTAQALAIRKVRRIYGYMPKGTSFCTGNTETCPVEECVICGVRDCPGREPLHYHHDGCPYCYTMDEAKEMGGEL